MGTKRDEQYKLTVIISDSKFQKKYAVTFCLAKVKFHSAL